MNKNQALDLRVNNPDLLVVSGSRLYGTQRADSDLDYRGFAIPPYEYLLGIAKFEDKDVEGADHKVYALRRYLELVLSGDPQCTELLFVPADKIVAKTKYGDRIFALREAIVSNKIYRRVMGYGYSEWRKARGVRLVIEDRTKTEDDVILDIRNVFEPDKDTMDGVLELLLQTKKQTIVPHLKNLGAKRKAEFEKYGFGVTSAAHAIRLTQQLAELMTTGTMTFPRPNADFLRDIRLGKYKADDLEEVYEESRQEADRARDNSILRDKPDSNAVWGEYEDMVRLFLQEDARFNS